MEHILQAMVKAMDDRVVPTPVGLLRSLSGKYPWERYEPPYPPSYGLNSTTAVLLVLYIDPRPSRQSRDCVNKWKNRGSRWTLENNITRCPDGLRQLETGCRSENQLQTEAFGPLVTPGWATQAKMRKKCCYGRRRTWGQYSCPSLSPLISHTQQTSTFENKVWEIYIFIKKCIRSLLKSSRHYSWLYSRVYLYKCSCMWLYNTRRKALALNNLQRLICH